MIAVAVSGGVDSLACLLLLRRQTDEPITALHGLFHAKAQVPPGLPAICAKLAVDLHIADLRREFEQSVIKYFIAEHAAGRTPNPCAICNSQIKFGALLHFANKLGASRLATGHYARFDGTLMSGADGSKDQSYFLSLTPAAALVQAIFPLGKFSKSQTRELVSSVGLAPPVPNESQDICFLAETGAAAFLAEHLPSRPGPVMLRPGINASPIHVGNHAGLWQYTLGQRRGLGIAWREPLYVCGKDISNNVLLLAPRRMALMRAALAARLNRFVEPELWPEQVLVKLRYNQKEAAAAWRMEEGMLRLNLAQAMLATAPGQVAAVYDADGRLLCGGIVEAVDMEGKMETDCNPV